MHASPRPHPPPCSRPLHAATACVRRLTVPSTRRDPRTARASFRSGCCFGGACKCARSWGMVMDAERHKSARALPTRRRPPCPPTPSLSCATACRGGVPECGDLHCCERISEPPELRGQAAAQVVFLKLPATGAPERDREQRRRTCDEGGKCDERAPPRPRPPTSPLHPLLPVLPRLGDWSAVWCGVAYIQLCQRDEVPELRRQTAAQAVAAKVPARGAPERDHG